MCGSLCLCAELGTAAKEQPAQGLREVSVAAIPDVVAPGAKWVLVWQGTDNADGLVGTPDGGLLFAQEQPHRVSKIDRDDKVSVLAENTRGAGSLAVDASGRVIAVERSCTDPGLKVSCAEQTAVALIYPASERRMLADSFEGKPLGRLNG